MILSSGIRALSQMKSMSMPEKRYGLVHIAFHMMSRYWEQVPFDCPRRLTSADVQYIGILFNTRHACAMAKNTKPAHYRILLICTFESRPNFLTSFRFRSQSLRCQTCLVSQDVGQAKYDNQMPLGAWPTPIKGPS